MIFRDSRSDTCVDIDSSGNQFWSKNYLCHRIDGPARIWSDDSEEWWENGRVVK